ncbi:MAG TPA: hypothetical protein VE981_05940 [Planctomycetota bacterium]|nr:hypothetical protein [Planctomycetota bacterium]
MGISMILVIVLVVFTLVITVSAAIFWANYKDAERRSALIRREIERQDAEMAVIALQLPKLNEPTGLGMGDEGRLSAPKANEAMKKWLDEYISSAALEKYPVIPAEKSDGRLTKEQSDKFTRARDESTYMRTLQALINPAVARTNHYKNRMEQLQLDLSSAEAQKKSREAVAPEIPKAKEETIAKLQKEIAKLNEQIAAEKAQFNERKTKFNEDKTKAETEISTEVEKYAADEIKINNEIRELKRQLEELKVKEVIKHEINFVHGKILRPDVPNKTAFINIGSRERVVPGLKFLVGNRGIQGKFEYKAKIEVKKAWINYCEVAIIESYDKDKPVVEGDGIVNPLFSKDRPILLAFVGEERPLRLRYSVDEATRRIKEIGSEVRKDVTLDVDYVVFTEAGSQKTRESYDPYKKAVFLEIPIADATDIFRFLGD